MLAAQKALILLHFKGPKAAEPFADEALRLRGDDAYVLINVARVMLMRGKLEKARDLLDQIDFAFEIDAESGHGVGDRGSGLILGAHWLRLPAGRQYFQCAQEGLDFSGREVDPKEFLNFGMAERDLLRL